MAHFWRLRKPKGKPLGYYRGWMKAVGDLYRSFKPKRGPYRHVTKRDVRYRHLKRLRLTGGHRQ